MSNGLEVFNQILFLNLRPWMQGQVSEQKYIELIQDIQKEHYQFQPLYKVEFAKPLNAKRKYYHALIENEAIKYFNNIHTVVSSAGNNGKKYRLNDYLNNKLKPKLKEVQQIIEEFGYTLEAVNTPNNATNYESLRDNSFIIQFLKLHIIKLYMEIQNFYADLLTEEPLTEVDIQQNFFFEDNLEKHYFTPADKINLPNQTKQTIVTTVEEELNVQKCHVGLLPKGGVGYDALVKNKEAFANVERQLFNEKIITGQYEFMPTQGNQKLLAAVFQTLIKKSYFNQFYFPGKKPVQQIHIKKFMNQRYQTDIDKEFRNFQDETLLQEYLTNHYWVSILPPC